jgi:type IV pilus assembly protein PilO
MTNLRELRRKLVLGLTVLLLLDAGAFAFLLSPWGRSVREFQDERNRLELARKLKQAEVKPARGMDMKLAGARSELEQFFAERMAGQASAVPDRLGALAAKHRVQLSQARYKTGESPVQGIQRVAIEGSLAGEYLDVVRFLNAVERDPMFFIIQSVALDDQEGGGTVRLELKLETYLRSEG